MHRYRTRAELSLPKQVRLISADLVRSKLRKVKPEMAEQAKEQIRGVISNLDAMVRGYLILHSGYLPRALGAFFILGGAGFVAKNVLVVAVPQYDVPYVLLPMFLAWCNPLAVDQGH